MDGLTAVLSDPHEVAVGIYVTIPDAADGQFVGIVTNLTLADAGVEAEIDVQMLVSGDNSPR